MGIWFFIILGGVAVGMLLGALGAGGSVITVPIFVFLLGQAPQVASASSLLVVAFIAATSIHGHARRKNIRFKSAVFLSVTASVGSTLGAWALKKVAGEAFLLGFAGLLVAGAFALWRVPAKEEKPAPDLFSAPTWRGFLRMAVLGLGIGFLTGFFGVGGGFLIVPALVVGMGFSMREAVGTSLVVVLAAAVAGLVPHVGRPLPWGQVVPFALAGALGSLLGQKAAQRFNTHGLRRAFSVGLLFLAVFLVAKTTLG